MFLNRLSIVFLLLTLISIAYSSEVVRYRTYPGKDVTVNVSTLLLNGPVKVSDRSPFLDCGMKCNLQSSCLVYTLNSSNHCTLYSNQTTVFALSISAKMNVYGKYKIKECLDTEMYGDYNLKKCIAKHMNGLPCNKTEQCSSTKGLTCYVNQCVCNDYDLK
jgi:hypothetical protein